MVVGQATIARRTLAEGVNLPRHGGQGGGEGQEQDAPEEPRTRRRPGMARTDAMRTTVVDVAIGAANGYGEALQRAATIAVATIIRQIVKRILGQSHGRALEAPDQSITLRLRGD